MHCIEFLDNQDFVWGTGLIISGLMVAIVVMRHWTPSSKTTDKFKKGDLVKLE